MLGRGELRAMPESMAKRNKVREGSWEGSSVSLRGIFIPRTFLKAHNCVG